MRSHLPGIHLKMHFPGPQLKPIVFKWVYSQLVGIHWQIGEFCICTTAISRILNTVCREKNVFYELKKLNYTRETHTPE